MFAFPAMIRNDLLIAFSFLLAAVILQACSDPPPPPNVYIPGSSFKVEVTISVPTTTVSVDEPLVLHGQRRATGFMQVPYSDVPDGVQWWRSQPPAFEEEVAGNLRWIVEPTGAARFNTDFRPDLTREVRFSKPGTYTLSATSNIYGEEPVSSKRVTITVVP